MMLFLAFRYSFSRTGDHRARVMRIAAAAALSLAVLMVTISVMEYLQAGRFDRIRDVQSFDIVLDGDCSEEMRTRFPDASVFVYGETEALSEGRPYIVRFIGNDYDGGLRTVLGDGSAMLVPGSLYLNSSGTLMLTMLTEGRSGRMLPESREYRISGAFSTSLGTSFDSSMLFLPFDEMPQGIGVHTALKGIDDKVIEDLREEGFSGESWKEQGAGLYSAFAVEKAMMYVVLSLLFVIILVSTAQSVRVFFSVREREMAELVVLGLDRRRAYLVFILSSVLVMLTGIALGLVLTYLMIPLGAAYASSIQRAEASLSVPYSSFLFFSFLLVAFTVFFSAMEERKSGRKDIMEVLSNE